MEPGRPGFRFSIPRRHRILVLLAVLIGGIFVTAPVISGIVTMIRCPAPEEGFAEGYARRATPLPGQYEHNDVMLTVEFDDGRRVDVSHGGGLRLYRHDARVVLSYTHRCAPDGPVFFRFSHYKPE